MGPAHGKIWEFWKMGMNFASTLCKTARRDISVVDPDSYDFGPPGSGSVIILYGSGYGFGPEPEFFHQQAKKVRKTLISTIF
jgi:hypothetical protein